MENNTVICNCMGVTKQDLIDAVTNGATTFEAVQAETNIAKGCGACTSAAEAVVAELMV